MEYGKVIIIMTISITRTKKHFKNEQRNRDDASKKRANTSGVGESNTVNSLFFIVEIFSDAHVVRKFVTRILFHYEIFSPTKYYLIRIFRTKVRTRE